MNKKSAFTLADVLLTLLIIAIVSVAAIHTITHLDNKSIKYLYSNAYHSLDRALYNSMTFTNLKNPFALTEYNTEEDPPVEEEVQPAEQTKRLCLMLIEYINTVSANCEAPAVSDMGDDLAEPHFITPNNMRFYISGIFPRDEEGVALPDQDHYFFLIFADLNGTKAPNSMEYLADEETGIPIREPDTFAFAALDIGRICPLGIAEYSNRYMQTRITYNQTKEDVLNAAAVSEGAEPDTVETVVKMYSKISKPYYITRAEAWGYGLGLIENEANFLIDQNPYTYNDYVKSNINLESNIYKFLDDNVFPMEGIELKSGKIDEGGYECEAGSDLECDVIIDKYLY